MSILKSITNLFKKEGSPGAEKGSKDDVPTESIEQSDDYYCITPDAYDEHDIQGVKRHTFEIRYGSYGEKSNMACAALNASLKGHEDTGIINALTMAIDMGGKNSATLLMVQDSKEGLSAESHFPREIENLRRIYGNKICELSDFKFERFNKSRRALGAMFHVFLLYARQTRQLKMGVVVTDVKNEGILSRLLGFKKLSQKDDKVILTIDLDFMKKEQRQWGGTKDEGKDSSYVLYPFFFQSKDEPGLLVRVMDHLGGTGTLA